MLEINTELEIFLFCMVTNWKQPRALLLWDIQSCWTFLLKLTYNKQTRRGFAGLKTLGTLMKFWLVGFKLVIAKSFLAIILIYPRLLLISIYHPLSYPNKHKNIICISLFVEVKSPSILNLLLCDAMLVSCNSSELAMNASWDK